MKGLECYKHLVKTCWKNKCWPPTPTKSEFAMLQLPLKKPLCKPLLFLHDLVLSRPWIISYLLASWKYWNFDIAPKPCQPGPVEVGENVNLSSSHLPWILWFLWNSSPPTLLLRSYAVISWGRFRPLWKPLFPYSSPVSEVAFALILEQEKGDPLPHPQYP